MTAIRANDHFISILDAQGTEFLLPYFAAKPVKLAGGFGSLTPATTPLHLDHLKIRQVQHIRATPEELIISTLHHNFSWKVHKP